MADTRIHDNFEDGVTPLGATSINKIVDNLKDTVQKANLTWADLKSQ